MHIEYYRMLAIVNDCQLLATTVNYYQPGDLNKKECKDL